MFLSSPPRTPYDVEFTIGTVPVRIHPLFWAIGLLWGAISAGRVTGPILFGYMALGALTLFLSILVHELGHVWMFARFGIRSRVQLHIMGGLAIPERGSRGLRHRDAILVSLAGPFAGFLLAGLVIALTLTTGGQVVYQPLFSVIPYWFALPPQGAPELWMRFLNFMLFVNIFWGLINLLPVFPLDGGQVSRSLFEMQDPREGRSRSLWLSVAVGAAMAVWALQRQDLWIVFLFGSLAYDSYMQLQRGRF